LVDFFYNSIISCIVELTGHLLGLSDEILLAVGEW